MRFTKMQGAGNDFVILNNMDGAIPEKDYSALASTLCERRISIGADGMMIVVPPKNGGDYGMRFFNSDGTAGEMCGNGARCIARYGHDNGLAGDIQRIESPAGLVIGERITDDRYRVRLNDPTVMIPAMSIAVSGKTFSVSYVELGDPGIPHCVLRLDDWDAMPPEELFALGRELRRYKGFTKGANVTFRKKIKDGTYNCITFERGVEDFTLACGTGAGSTAAVINLLEEDAASPLLLHFPGGLLELEVTRNGDSVTDILLTGSAVTVCTGDYMGK